MSNEASSPSGLVHQFASTIHEGHLDTFGHVNNAKYLELFEQARWDWITSGGYGLTKINETRKGPVVLECTLSFRRELTNRQPILIRSWIEKFGPKVSTVRQDLELRAAPSSSASDVPGVCCSATFTMAFFDLSTRRIIEPTTEWRRALGVEATAVPST